MLTLRHFFTPRKPAPKQGRNLRSESGLTLTETFVTMAILSMIIVLSLALIIFIGRVYNRGIQTNKLQDVTNTITTHISETIRTSGVRVHPFENPTWGNLIDVNYNNDWYGYCIGDTQYSYRLNTQLIADDGKTTPILPNQADQVFIVSRACNSDLLDADPAKIDTDLTTSGTQLPEQFELLHDRMRILGFSIDKVGDYDDLYDIRLKLAIGGDAADPMYELEIFEFIDHPCEHPTSSSPSNLNLQLVFEGSCNNIKNEWVPVTTPPQRAGNWEDPNDEIIRPRYQDQDEEHLPRLDGTPPMIINREVIIHKCEGTATLCGVMETRTRVFRRVF